MMKKGLLAGAMLLAAGAVNAQGMYVGVTAGYGFSTPGDALGEKTVITSNGDRTDEVIYGSLGGGVNTGLNFGYMFSEHFGADLGLNYFIGSQVTTMDVTVPSGTATLMSKSSQMRISPSLVISTGGDLAAYGRLGLVIPAGGSTQSEYRDDTNPLQKVEQDIETKGAFSLGYQGAIGVSMGLGDKLSLFGELSGVNLRIKRGSSTVTMYKVNGTDVLPNADKYDIETTYVDELGPNSNNSGYNSNASTSQPKEELASTTNFNGLFINVGVKFNF